MNPVALWLLIGGLFCLFGVAFIAISLASVHGSALARLSNIFGCVFTAVGAMVLVAFFYSLALATA